MVCSYVSESSSLGLCPGRRHCIVYLQGSTLEKKLWGQLAPKFIDLVASTTKKFSALRAKEFYLKFSFDTVKLRFLLSLLLSRFPRITLIFLDFFSSKEKETQKTCKKKTLNCMLLLFFIYLQKYLSQELNVTVYAGLRVH